MQNSDLPSFQSHRPVGPQERQRLIAEAAYRRAEQRNFTAGDPLDDWLQAEREIDRSLGESRSADQESAAYERLRAGFRKALAELREVRDSDTVRRAFDWASEELKRTGAYTTDAINRAGIALRRELADANQRLGPRWEQFAEKSGDFFGVWRDRSALFLADATRAIGDWMQDASSKLDQQKYSSGEMVYQGTFVCTRCGNHRVLDTSGRLPECTCGSTVYRRV
jgi:hypothetical protein